MLDGSDGRASSGVGLDGRGFGRLFQGHVGSGEDQEAGQDDPVEEGDEDVVELGDLFESEQHLHVGCLVGGDAVLPGDGGGVEVMMTAAAGGTSLCDGGSGDDGGLGRFGHRLLRMVGCDA